jgi:hypothetical protein
VLVLTKDPFLVSNNIITICRPISERGIILNVSRPTH